MEDQYLTPPPVPEQTAETMEDIPPLKPNNWLWQSIVVTLLCCAPVGIVGIVHAAKVDILYFSGKYREAEAAARTARTWTLVALFIGIAAAILWIVVMSTGNMPQYMEQIIEDSASGYNF